MKLKSFAKKFCVYGTNTVCLYVVCLVRKYSAMHKIFADDDDDSQRCLYSILVCFP